MKKIMFNDKYGLTQAVLAGQKTMTRRLKTEEDVKEPKFCWGLEGEDKGRLFLCDGSRIVAKSFYKVGEVLAVAQRYADVLLAMIDSKGGYGEEENDFAEKVSYTKGYDNKMFVKAAPMPHHIKITDIKAERLQDISNEDCLREGIVKERVSLDGQHEDLYTDIGNNTPRLWRTPREAFAALIDKVSGKGAWERNPWVFAYSFERVD